MNKINKHIEIVRSTNTLLSSLSKPSSLAILKTLSDKYLTVGITEVNNLDDLNLLVLKKPDLVFLGMKFIPEDNTVYSQHSPKIWVSEYLEKYEIPYTGSGSRAHLIELDKSLAKQRLIDMGISTSPYIVIKQDEDLSNILLDIEYPLFVKPSNRGGGLGIDKNSLVRNYSQLLTKVNSIKNHFKSDSLIEKYLNGREFSVAILKNISTNDLIVMPIEIVVQPDENGLAILSGKVKSADTEVVSRVINLDLKSRISKLAKEAFIALGARDYGRIDIRLDEDGTPYFLEANLIPSLINNYGNFPKAAKLNFGMTYEDVIYQITDLALNREAKTLEINPIINPDLNIKPIIQNLPV